MKKEKEYFIENKEENKYKWTELQMIYHESICFATRDGFETFKKEVLGKDNEVDFNKYLPISVGHPSQALNRWGCLEAYDTSIDETNNIIRFNTFLDIPNLFIEMWSKHHPNIVFVCLYNHETNNINEVIFGTAYKNGEKETYTYTQNCVSKREFKKDPQSAWKKYYEKFYNCYVMDRVLELLKEYNNN